MSGINFSALSLNVKGLKSSYLKRKKLFEYLQNRKEKIVFFQETHSTTEMESTWNSEFQGEIFYSHGRSNSKGVAILIKNSLEYSVEEKITDQEGRLIILKIEVQGSSFYLVNCYAPVDEKEQISFFNLLSEKLSEICMDENNLVIGGDFNVIFDPTLDKEGGRTKLKQQSLNILYNIMENFDLIDIWRIRNADKRRFTWRQKTPLIQCRLDFWLISDVLQDLTVKTDIISAILTDHSAITIEFKSSPIYNNGPSYWKLNTEHLYDKEYIDLINTNFPLWIKEFHEFQQDKRKLWDLIKYRIRQISGQFSKKKARERRITFNLLEKQLLYAEARVSDFPSEDNLATLEEIKHQMDKELEKNVKGLIFRSKVAWYEEGEKNSKFFLNLQKRNKSKSTVRKLILDNEVETNNPKTIQTELKTFYQNLYKSNNQKSNIDEIETFINSAGIPKLSKEDKESCEGKITFEELREIIPTFKHNKTPGNDGIPIEFYIVFFNLIGNLLVEVFNESLEAEELSTSQKQGIITLIEKKGQDKRFIKNWRPISLMNVDTKIASKIITKRIERVLPKIIHGNQTAYIKGRFIGEGLRLIDDLLQFTKENNLPGVLITIDFQKAFDSVEWNFIHMCLKEFNFGQTLIQWVRTFYANINSCIMNGGFSTGYFELNRGVRQGDPLSPFLFVIALEVLLNHIRKNNNIKGIKICGNEIKLSAFADDLTLFLDTTKSAENLLNFLESFGQFSGLHVNKEKCEALWIGSNKDKMDFPLDIRWSKCVKILGIYFSYNNQEMIDKNFYANMKLMKDTCRIWSRRNISILGKISVVKSLIISKLNYVCTVLYTPKAILKEVNSILFSFLWGGNDKVKRKAIISNLSEGGLKMIDFESFVHAKSIIWIKKLLDNSCCDWKIIPFELMKKYGNPLLLFSSSYSISSLKLDLPLTFYTALLKSWEMLITLPQNEKPHLEQVLWNNKNIRINNTGIFFRSFFNKGIIFVHQLFDNNGKLLSWEIFKQSYNLPNYLWLKYYGLIEALPNEWKNQGLDDVIARIDVLKPVLLKFDSQNYIDLAKANSKQIYNLLLNLVIEKPTGKIKLVEKFKLLESDCSDIFTLPFLITISNQLRAFQYKILHNILYLNEFLSHKAKWSVDPLCTFCKTENETIQHLFFECIFVKTFWNELYLWLDFSLDTINEKTIILGQTPLTVHNIFLNFVTLVAKKFIYSCRYKTILPTLRLFKFNLKSYHDIELQIAKKKGKEKKHSKKWKLFLKKISFQF